MRPPTDFIDIFWGQIAKSYQFTRQEYKRAGYAFHRDAPRQRSEEELEGLTRFFMCLGQAKHEPCGEHWDASYGETAWRMAVAALCLPPGRCNRARLVRVALSSALTCVGSRTDHCSEWKDKGCFHLISRVVLLILSISIITRFGKKIVWILLITVSSGFVLGLT